MSAADQSHLSHLARTDNDPPGAEQLEPDDAQADILDSLVTSLYSCVEHKDGFDLFLRNIRDTFDLVSCCLAVIQKEPHLKGLYGWAVGYPPGIVPLMLKTGLVFKDKAIARALETGPNALFSYADGDPESNFLADMPTFSRTWIRAAGIIDSATIAFTNKYQQHVVLVFNRHKDSGVFSKPEMAMLSRLKKHAEIALDLYERLHRSEQSFKDLQSSIAVLKQPVAVFSPVSLLVSASPAFVEIGRCYKVFTINQDSREIAFKDQQFGKDFYTQLMLFITGKTGALDDSDTLYLQTSALPLRISITPVHNRQSNNSNVLVEIFDPNVCRTPSIAEIRKVISATEAEARVCLCLLKGASTAEAAEQLQLAISTIRTNIKSLLQKNNFRRQVDLITHLMRICS